MLRKIVMVMAIMMFGLVSMAGAAIMTFDEINISGAGNYQDITNYQGFDFTNASILNTQGLDQWNGYLHGCVSPHNVLFNPWGNDLRIDNTTDFTFNRGYFTLANQYSGMVTVTGYNHYDELYSTEFEVNMNTPSLINFNWTGINRVLISSNENYHLSMDNFRFNEGGEVPIPPTILLFGSSLIGMVTIGRRKFFNN